MQVNRLSGVANREEVLGSVFCILADPGDLCLLDSSCPWMVVSESPDVADGGAD